MSDILARLERKAIPVVRTDTRADAEQVVFWLAEAGVRIFEVTLTTPGATELISALTQEADLLVGAGTVHEADAARAALDAGAQFLVSPRLSEDVVRLSRDADTPCICGALTPSEIATANAYGADAIKIFPVNAVGGAGYIRSVRDVFPELVFIPTGGIRIDDVSAYFDAGAYALGVGGALVDKSAIARGDSGAIKAAAASLADIGAL